MISNLKLLSPHLKLTIIELKHSSNLLSAKSEDCGITIGFKIVGEKDKHSMVGSL
jgi:hypothetical protein